MILTFDAWLADGLGSFGPVAERFEWEAGEQVTLRGTLRHSDGSAFDFYDGGNYAVLMAWKAKATDADPLVTHQATLLGGGVFQVLVDASDVGLGLGPGQTTCDAVLATTVGQTTTYKPILRPSSTKVTRMIVTPGAPVTVPSSQPALQQPIAWRGTWSNVTAYQVNDGVVYLDASAGSTPRISSFRCVASSTNNPPVDNGGALDTAHWAYVGQCGQDGTNGAGSATPFVTWSSGAYAPIKTLLDAAVATYGSVRLLVTATTKLLMNVSTDLDNVLIEGIGPSGFLAQIQTSNGFRLLGAGGYLRLRNVLLTPIGTIVDGSSPCAGSFSWSLERSFIEPDDTAVAPSAVIPGGASASLSLDNSVIFENAGQSVFQLQNTADFGVNPSNQSQIDGAAIALVSGAAAMQIYPDATFRRIVGLPGGITVSYFPSGGADNLFYEPKAPVQWNPAPTQAGMTLDAGLTRDSYIREFYAQLSTNGSQTVRAQVLDPLNTPTNDIHNIAAGQIQIGRGYHVIAKICMGDGSGQGIAAQAIMLAAAFKTDQAGVVTQAGATQTVYSIGTGLLPGMTVTLGTDGTQIQVTCVGAIANIVWKVSGEVVIAAPIATPPNYT